MNKLTIVSQQIKESVSAIDVANALGWEIRHGRCKCPIHNGDGFNCRLYPGNRGYMCWVCKSAGDVISLVRNYYSDMSYKDCLKWFNSTFNLGLDIDGYISPEKRKQAENALLRRKRAIELQAWKDKMKFNLAMAADRIVQRLEEERDTKRPRTYGEEWDEDFCAAVVTLPEARAFADECMMNCMKEQDNGGH